jgi:YVTN family beta-propeller protein
MNKAMLIGITLALIVSALWVPALQANNSVASEPSSVPIITGGPPADPPVALVGTVRVGSSPDPAVYDPSNGYVYVGNVGSSNVTVISGTTKVATIGVGAFPSYIAYDPSDSDIYVSCGSGAEVSVISGTSLVTEIPVSHPGYITYDANDGEMYVASTTGTTVSVITTTSVTSTITVASDPNGITYDPADGDMYVGFNTASSAIEVIHGTTDEGTIPVGTYSGQGIFDPSNDYVYIGGYPNTLFAISGTTLEATLYSGTTVQTGPYAPSSGYVYVVGYSTNNVTIFSGTSKVTTLRVGTSPYGAATDGFVSSEYDFGNGYVIIPNSGQNNVTIINDTSELTSFHVGTGPDVAEYDNASGYMYIVNTNSNNVTVLSFAPGAPINLASGTLTSSTVPLTWTSPSGTIVNDTVYYTTASGCAGTLTAISMGGSASSYTVTGLTGGTSYYFEVTAWNSTGQSLDSGCLKATLPGGAPGAPTGLTVGSVTTTTIPLTWTNPSGTLVNNTVYYFSGASCTGHVTAVSMGSAATSYTITGLASATEYAVEVTAWTASGQSPDSSCVDGTTLPTAPTSPAASPVSSTSITVTWTNPSGTLTDNYVFWEAGSSCSSATKVDIGSVVTTYTKTALSSNTLYCFYVQAVSAGGPSASSSIVTATTPVVPAAPTGLAPTGETTTTISIGWTNPTTGGLVNNTVYYTTASGCTGVLTAISMGGVVTSYTITGLSGGTTYYVEVTVWNTTGQSPDSSCVPMSTLGPPNPPTGLTIVTTTYTTIQISWTNPNGPLVNNTVYYTLTASCSGALIAISMGGVVTGYTITALSDGVTYYIEVTAWNVTGQSAKSSCVPGTTLTSPPSSPTSLLFTPVFPTQILLAWTNPSGVLTDDYVFWESGVACSSPAKIDIGSVVGQYVLTGLSSATEYCAYVEAVGAGGASNPSVTVTNWTFPNAPTGLFISLATAGSLTFGWTNPSGNLLGDYFYWETGSSCSTSNQVSVGLVTSYDLFPLRPTTQYCAYVEAFDVVGNGNASSVVSGTTLSTVAMPTNLVVTGFTSVSISVNWTNPPGVTNNTVWYEPNGFNDLQPLSTSGEVLNWTITGLTPSTVYAIEVQAWIGIVSSGLTNYVIQATNSTPFVPPTSPTPTTVTTAPLLTLDQEIQLGIFLALLAIGIVLSVYRRYIPGLALVIVGALVLII